MRYIPYFHGLGPQWLRPVERPERLPAWLPAGRTTLVARASHALYLGWRALGMQRGDAFLCPAFACNTVNRPLAKAGGRAVYFNVLSDGGIDWDHLRSLPGRRPRPRVMLWYHYLGLPREFGLVQAFCREHGLRLIEDAAHTLFGRDAAGPIGTLGDIAVFSIRKILPVPAAGALVVNAAGLPRRAKVNWARPTPGQQGFLLNREAYLHRLFLQSLDRTAAVERPVFRETLNQMEHWYGDPRRLWPIDPVSRLVMHNARPEAVRRVRRANFRGLLDGLGELALVGRLGRGACPMGFPLRVANRDRLQRRLLECGIESVPHWGRKILPRGVTKRFATAGELADTVLTLPVHQDLSAEDVAYICDCVRRHAG